jgi:MFS family permease
VARGLLAVNVAMIVGYLGFGRAADRFARAGRSPVPLLAGGVAVSSASLGLILLGLKNLAPLLWFLFVACGTAVVLSYSILARRYPKEMSGRANTAINTLGFAGMFAGQSVIGVVLDLWPKTATGYAPEAYPWAFGVVWLAQLGGLLWFLAGRRLLGRERVAPAAR